MATLLLLAGCASSGSATPAHRDDPAATRPAEAAVEQGAWRPIKEAPIPPAGGMAAVWTGRQLVVWGGQAGDGTRRASGDGAAYDPGADRWEALPPAPVAGRFGTSAVWTGREVLFWGGQAGPDTRGLQLPPTTATFADGAAYDPATRRWRTLPVAPIGARTGHQAVWTGREMIVWGGYSRCCPIDSVIHDPAAAAYDPATDRWRRIADVPPPWSGDDGTAATVVDDDRPLIWRHSHLAAYDPATDRWGEASGGPPPPAPVPAPAPGNPALPSATTGDPFVLAAVDGGDGASGKGGAGGAGAGGGSATGSGTGAGTGPRRGGAARGREVFTWTGNSGQRLNGVAWRPSDSTWRRIAPLDGQSGAAVTAGGPGRIYAAAGQSARVLEYRIADDRWEELPLAPIPTRSAAVLVWTGSELLFWGGIGDEGPEMNGATWHCC
ncbi:MAG: hypothetical protein QOE80_1625 [Actinomycetota bacterium]|nr:hypothetical protein [Actinomycetota bacterium]